MKESYGILLIQQYNLAKMRLKKKYFMIPLALIMPLIAFLAEGANSGREWVGTGCEVDGSYVPRSGIVSNPQEQSVHIVPVNIKGQIGTVFTPDYSFLLQWGYRDYAGTVPVHSVTDGNWSPLYNGYEQTHFSLVVMLNGQPYSVSDTLGKKFEDDIEACWQNGNVYLRK